LKLRKEATIESSFLFVDMNKSGWVRRSAAEWELLLEEQAASGESQAAFFQRKGLSVGSFQNAKKRQSPGQFNPGQSNRGQLIELGPERKSFEAELLFPNGIVLRVRG
jgi:hypothetical protein